MFKIKIFLVTIFFMAGCTTMQEDALKARDEGKKVLEATIDVDVDQAKQIVREVAREIELKEIQPGSNEYRNHDENFLLFTDLGLGKVAEGFLLGPFAKQPSTLGIFFEYEDNQDQTKITISEYNPGFGDRKLRKDFLERVKLKSFGLTNNFTGN